MYEKVLMSSNQHYAAQVGCHRIPQSATIYTEQDTAGFVKKIISNISLI